MNQTNKDIKEYIRQRDQGTCQACGVYCWSQGNIAHRINQSKVSKKLYGNNIIDHNFNKVWTCFGNGCNDSFNIANKPMKVKRLIELIKKHEKELLTTEEINGIIN